MVKSLINEFVAYGDRIWKYRDLFLVFIWREFSVRYKHTIIGAAWAVVQPLSMMLLFTFLFSYVLKTKVSDYPYAVFFYSGILPWTLFDTSIKYSVPSFQSHYGLITKIYFPREIIPLSCISIAFIDFLVSFVVYVILLLCFSVPITANILYLVPLLILMMLFVSSISLLLACLNVFYRDVKLAIGFLMQLWFFATPVFYGVDKLEGSLKWLLYLNPMTFFVESFRKCSLGGQSIDNLKLFLAGLAILCLFYLSVKVLIRVERLFADVL